MDPLMQKANYDDLKKSLKGPYYDFRFKLDEGWSRLPPWADYKLLVEAIKRDCDEEVELLLERGCRVMKPGCINTPLHSIVKKRWWDLIEKFLERGARVSDPDSEGNSIVHLINDSDIPLYLYDVLLKRHQQETTVNVKNQHGFSFLHIACTLKDVELVKKCLDHNPEDLNCQVSLNEPFRPGFTPLHCAIEFNEQVIVEVFLDRSADLDIQNANGSTPLHYALEVKLRFIREDTTVLDLLMTHYYVVKDITDNKGRSLLMAACAASDVVGLRIIQSILVEKVNDADNDGNSALHFAARFGRYSHVNSLMQSGAQCCRANNRGLTPLAMAQERGHENVCNLLRERCRCNNQPTA